MEHYLAFQKALLSQQEDIIQRAIYARDPTEAKSILNLLRKDYNTEWEQIREDTAIKGLREKFRQNEHLTTLLRDTRGLKIGEASRNPCWGIGLTLEDPQVLDTSKWNSSANLLGKLLMKIRSEITPIGTRQH